MQNSVEIFTMGLGLTSPWKVSEVYFETHNGEQELHIRIGFEKGSRFLGKDGKSYTAYDTVDRTWQHLNFFQHKCFLHCKVPRVKESDKSITTQEVPWSRKGSGFTLLFEAYSMLLIESEMPVSKVAHTLSVYSQRIWTIFNHWIDKARKSDVIKELKYVGFDETSSKKGHNYVTVGVDLEASRIVFVTEGKDSSCIEKAVEYFESKEVDKSQIEQVSIDMSTAFISGCNTYLPNAAITFDKFHIIKEVNNAMDELRKQERKGNSLLKKHKYTFLKNKLSSDLQSEKHFLLEMYPKLGEGYKLVQLFKEFWDISDPQEAEAYLSYWCDLAEESGIFSFKKVVAMIKSHWSGIINYTRSRINNGILEGINSKIQLAKRRARGFRNIQNFINMIYFIGGKLNYDYPRYFI